MGGLHRQVIDLVQKVSDMRYKLGGGEDEGITIPKVQGSLWVPQVSNPDVSLLPYTQVTQELPQDFYA